MPRECSKQTRGDTSAAINLQDQWLQDSECYYEVRLGQRSNTELTAQKANSRESPHRSSGYVAKYSTSAGMEILTQQVAASVRLADCALRHRNFSVS